MNKFKQWQLCWYLQDKWNDEGWLEFYVEPVIILKVPESDAGSYLVIKRDCKYYSAPRSVLFNTEEEAIMRADLLANGVIR